MRRWYVVTLTDEERQTLRELISSGKAAARKLMHARILLKADSAKGGPAWTDAVISESLEVGTARFQLLYCFIVLRHDRRRVVRFNVTPHPTARWTAQQIVEAFPCDEAPRFLIRDRDGVYGNDFRRRIKRIGLEEVLIAYRSPWQNPFVGGLHHRYSRAA